MRYRCTVRTLVPGPLRRDKDDPEVSSTELFYDLVYVFVAIQLAKFLVEHLTGLGALQAAVMFAAAWWAWNYTTWTAVWLDPRSLPVRGLFLTLMLLTLIMASAIPEAFDGRGLEFALAVAAMQVLRPLFMVVALRGHREARYFHSVATWSIGAGVLWIAGGLMDDGPRLALWVGAIAVELAGPVFKFRLVGVPAVPLESWPVAPGHLAERCRLIVIVALGEAVLSCGRTYADLEPSVATVGTLVIGFATCGALWWLYFARHSTQALNRMRLSSEASRMGLHGYAYSHALIVGAILATAVGTELMIAHPGEATRAATGIAIVGGPLLYIVGLTLFVHLTGGVDRTEGAIVAVVVFTFLAAGAGSVAAGAPLVVPAAIVLGLLIALVGAAAWHARRAPDVAGAAGATT